MNIYIIFSIGISALFFCINNDIFNWIYNIVISSLVLFLFLLRLIPSYRFERLKNIVVFSVVAILFLMMSILAAVVRHEVLLGLVVFFHELIFFYFVFKFHKTYKSICNFGFRDTFGIIFFEYWFATWLCCKLDLYRLKYFFGYDGNYINLFNY